MGIKMWEIKLDALIDARRTVVASDIREALEKAEKVDSGCDIIGIELLAEEDEPSE